MLFPTVLLALSSVASFASAQSIDPESVPEATRAAWCNDQETSCPLLCMQLKGADGEPIENDCDEDTLAYSCVCSNNQSPNATEYSQTIPYYICTEANNQCVNNCNGDSTCQTACREDNPCGAQSPKRVTVTATTKTAAATGTSTATDVVYTGLGEGSASGGGDDKGGAAGHVTLQMGQVYGVGVVVAGFLAGFAVLL
ncbi:hypothetical protein FQN50_003133 [Emmonsiellopsis sp. PD_5]|nr:hypothetical protein FQN50_003133 [Emmonsiellopsis sp. PD_5]